MSPCHHAIVRPCDHAIRAIDAIDATHDTHDSCDSVIHVIQPSWLERRGSSHLGARRPRESAGGTDSQRLLARGQVDRGPLSYSVWGRTSRAARLVRGSRKAAPVVDKSHASREPGPDPGGRPPPLQVPLQISLISSTSKSFSKRASTTTRL